MKSLKRFALALLVALTPPAFAQYTENWLRIGWMDVSGESFVFVATTPAQACPGGNAWFTIRTTDPQYKAVYKLVTTAKLLGSKLQVWTVNGIGLECRPVFVELRAD